MSRLTKTLVVGIGSAHGDDQAGWLVAEQLAVTQGLPLEIDVRKASVPLDVLNWLDDVETLHVCDACYSEARGVPMYLFRLSENRLIPVPMESGQHSLSFESLHHGGSHDFGLPEVLRLAAATGQLPPHVFVWAICGSAFLPDDTMTEQTLVAVTETVRRLCEALQTAEPTNA